MITSDRIIRDITNKAILLSRFKINTWALLPSHNIDKEIYISCSISVSIRKILKVNIDKHTQRHIHINIYVYVFGRIFVCGKSLLLRATNAVLSLTHTYTYDVYKLKH